MSIFLRELKVHWKVLLFWCLGVILLIGSEMTEYTSFKGNSKAVIDLVSQFPKSVQTIFGLTGFDLTKASGYFGMLYMYIVVIVAAHAVLIGSGLISKEEREKTSEFLFVKPVSRSKIITEKLMAGIFNMVILNIATLLSSIYFVGYHADGEPYMANLIILMIGLLFLQLIFFFIGTTIAAISRKPKLSGIIATSILLLTFIMAVFVNVSDSLDWLSYLTPFKYFDAKNLMANGGFDVKYLVISGAIVILTIFQTYKSYNARDLNV